MLLSSTRSVMSVEPGFGGQAYARRRRRAPVPEYHRAERLLQVEVDGGVSEEHAYVLCANVTAAGSAV